MYHLMNRNGAVLIRAIDGLGDISAYGSLRDSLRSADVATDFEFQRTYRNYWRMNVGRFKPAFYARYFELMSDCQRSGSADLKEVLRSFSELGAESRGLQFSFATKLVHMVDPRVPVYDNFIAAFYFFVPLGSKVSHEERVDHLVEFHEFLTVEYARIIQKGLLSKAISEFREGRSINSEIPDERVIDWLIWAWVAHLRSGAQRKHQTLFE